MKPKLIIKINYSTIVISSNFIKWQCIRKVKVTGNTWNFDITNIYRNLNNPIWVFVVFQTERTNNQQGDNHLFDYIIRKLWIEQGGKHYSEEFLNLNFMNNFYCFAYRAFQDFRIYLY